jgi:Peptidyl-prolyl cis-trans isomerase (rotamase) - cyclophilin family
MKKFVLLFVIAMLFAGSIGEGGKNRTALIKTNMGDIKVTLFEDKAPITTRNFIALVESGFYNGLTFHRIIKGFMIQGGDPKGDGTGSSNKTIPLEIHEDLTHVDGALGMARSEDPDSASCQFYVCDGPQHFLDGNYAVFGKVVEGMDVVREIASVPTDENDRPLEPVIIENITIE